MRKEKEQQEKAKQEDGKTEDKTATGSKGMV